MEKENRSIITNGPRPEYFRRTKRFTVIIPKMKAVLTFFPNAQTTVELLTEPQFQNRVKMQYVIYPNFEYTTKGIMKQAMKLIFAKFSPQLQITG